MKIYIDTEFTSFGLNFDIKLISAGFVAEDRQEFYFELTDNFEEGECSTFVLDAVLPHLDAKKHGMCKAEAWLRLKVWVQSFNEPVEFCSDAPGYDWGLIYDFFEEFEWPSNLVRKPVNVNTHAVLQGIERYFECQPMAIRHHALWDARALAAAVKGPIDD